MSERGARELVESWAGVEPVGPSLFHRLMKQTAYAVLFIACVMIVMGGLAAAAWVVGDAIVNALAGIDD